MATIWVIWKGRNSQCFEDKVSAKDLLRDNVKLLVASCVSPLLFRGLSVDVTLRNWKEVAFASPAPFDSVHRRIPPSPTGPEVKL